MTGARCRNTRGMFTLTMTLAAWCGVGVVTGRAAEVVFADGRRESVEDPRADKNGRWLATRDGRRTVLIPGEVVAVISDDGEETVIIPPLSDEMRPEHEAALEALKGAKGDEWHAAAEQLAQSASRPVLTALGELAGDRKKDLRARAIGAMIRLRTRESTLAAAETVLVEKDKTVRRDAASGLFAVSEILRRCELGDLIERGLADRDAAVRIDFALLAPRDVEEAVAVLTRDGLKSSDHHVRESAALELGLRSDPAGESVLLGMLARRTLPGFDADQALMVRYLIAEQVRVCEALGRIATDKATAALAKTVDGSPHPAVRAAAERALAAGD